ncbi:MAG: hypothetical protein NVV59_19520 [Chitinophagaceae bacterium]|nr:hypothetical protein [Chitinophagaceae bacterium]
MKKIFPIVTIILLTSCNNDNKVVVKDDSSGVTTITPTTQDFGKEYQDNVEKLQKLTPYTSEEMKALLPETLGGANRSNVSVTNLMGTSYASADYEIDETTTVSLKIMDCAGEAGVGIYSLQFIAALNLQQEDDDEITRTVDFNGEKAVEHIEKNGSEATLMWLAKGRLMATLEGNGVTIETIRDLAKSSGL